jgi:hypothetical protein
MKFPIQYKGDSFQITGGDIFSTTVGYTLGTVFFDAGVWWLSVVWIYLSEVRIYSCVLTGHIRFTLKILNVVIYNLSK